jgi:hypothetical protein
MRSHEDHEAGVRPTSIQTVCPVSINKQTKVVSFLLLEVKTLVHGSFQETKELNFCGTVGKARGSQDVAKAC